jgi:hypothetical protein
MGIAVHSRTCVTRGCRELQKILPEEYSVGRVGPLGEERAAKAFPCPQNLPPAKATPTRIDGCQVEQLERASESVIASIDAAGVMRS